MGSGETTLIVDNSASPPPGSLSLSTSPAMPADALRLAEVERTRAFMRLTLLSMVAFLLSLPLFSGDATFEVLIGVLLGIGLLHGIWFYRRIRDPRRYSYSSMLLISASAVINAQVVVVYFGVFSAAVMMLVLGIYFLGRTENASSALFVYALVAGMQAIASGLIIAGVVADPGLMKPPSLSTAELVLAQFFIQVILFAAYVTGRSTRATTARAMDDLQQAMQVAAERGALLQEARAELDRALQVGDPGPFTNRLLGGYQLGVVIGRGAMGDVYAATHAEGGQRAAVKLLPTSVLGDRRFVERFMREARAASRLESPHVVRVIDQSAPDAPLPYLIMERLEGHDLAAALRRRERLRPDEVGELVRQIGSVIDLARDHGIVHRDLKPQNVYLTERPGELGVWKLLDFGVAALEDQSDSLTGAHAVGTPSYMAPEQARSQEVDHRADLYSLAAVAYRCITGRPVFAARDVPALLYDVVHKMPERPSDLADIPADLDAVLAIGLAKRRDDRFASGVELAEAYDAACKGELADALRDRATALIERWPWGVRR